MKNPEAHEIILQIIMDDPTLKLEEDDIRKRSRYYQGLLDTPILKSGKETRYKNLPSTVIIFITKEDIFGENLAKYTFTEQWLDNPEILIRDERIEKLDSAVSEVRESEEWEAVSMSIYSVGLEKGREKERIELICKKLRKGKMVEVIAEDLEEEIDVISKICDFAARFAPEYDAEKVFEAWLQQNNSI